MDLIITLRHGRAFGKVRSDPFDRVMKQATSAGNLSQVVDFVQDYARKFGDAENAVERRA